LDLVSDVTQKPWPVRVAFFRGLDGELIELLEDKTPLQVSSATQVIGIADLFLPSCKKIAGLVRMERAKPQIFLFSFVGCLSLQAGCRFVFY
jgi:hypothetical protein